MAAGKFGGTCVGGHSVYITDRGGTQRVAQLVDISQIQWGRLRDATSEAVVQIRGAACRAQAPILEAIEPKRSEMVIYRGDERVWEGPVNRVGWHQDWVEVAAVDASVYLFGRPLSKVWDNSYPNNTKVTARMKEIIEYEMTHTYTYISADGDPVVLPAWEHLDPPANVLPFLVVHEHPNEAGTSAETTPFQMTVGEHLDNFARTGGIDYTMVGRALHIWDTSRYLGKTRLLTSADFDGEVVVSAYGADLAAVAFAVADDGRWGGYGGVETSWRILEKSGPEGVITEFPPKGYFPRLPSLVDSGSVAWGGYRYWMVYRPDAPNQSMRLSASKDGVKWVTPANKRIDADSGTTGTPPKPITFTPGNWPDISFSDDDRLWVFWVDGNAIYRSRTEDGKDFTSKVLIYNFPGGVSLISPSLYWDAPRNSWLLFAVDIGATPDRLVFMRSTSPNLDAAGQWGPLTPITIAGNPVPTSITVRKVGSEWVGLVTVAGVAYLITAPVGKVVAQGFTALGAPAFPGAFSGLYGSTGKATFTVNPNGSLKVYFEGQGSAWNILRTTLSGPDPVIGVGDENLDYYGPWTKIFTVYDEDESHSPTQADLNSQAKRNLAGRIPVPIEVRVPDNSTIRLSEGLTFDDLVPGTQMPLLADLNARRVAQMQKLDKVTVTETADGETISVTLIPATKPDEDEEEGDL